MHTPTSQRKKRLLKSALSGISQHTINFLTPLLFLLTIAFLWFAIAFYIDIKSDFVKALAYYSSVCKNLMMSLLLAIGCAVIFDISISELDKK